MPAGKTYTCGLDAAVDVIGGKWKPIILWELHAGRRRFGALRRALDGVSEKILAQQLRELEADGLVHREVFAEVPPRVEYSLTELGQSLHAALEPLGDWGHVHMERIAAARGGSTSPAVDPYLGNATSDSWPSRSTAATPKK